MCSGDETVYGSSSALLLLIPGSSIISKCYPSRKLLKLTNLVKENFYIIWGNEFERKIAENIKKMAKPNATIDIVNACENLLNKYAK